jgi:hypothetical protein
MNIGRNDPCPCGSGKKYKKCCEGKKPEPKKFTAQVISSGMDQTTNKISKLFQRPPPPPSSESGDSGNA